jgi:DNA (cytosine-5)-methyltransferase 1
VKILNLYACLGGNRYKWDEVTACEVTAVELDPEAARLYQERFPQDTVIVADAHEYLRLHYKEFDFIWSSPPCPTHSRFQYSMKTHRAMQYPDMALYEEIIFLQAFYNGKYCVENVRPYYEPLIAPQYRHRHAYWTNFAMPAALSSRTPPPINSKTYRQLCDFHNYDFDQYRGKQDKHKMARNLVDYEAGKTILETACGIIRSNNTKQLSIL